MQPKEISYNNKGEPKNLPEAGQLVLWGLDGCDAEGPVIGGWDFTLGVWSDDKGFELDFMPTFCMELPDNPQRSFTPPTVNNEVI